MPDQPFDARTGMILVYALVVCFGALIVYVSLASGAPIRVCGIDSLEITCRDLPK
jgi:hypothetical protein